MPGSPERKDRRNRNQELSVIQLLQKLNKQGRFSHLDLSWHGNYTNLSTLVKNQRIKNISNQLTELKKWSEVYLQLAVVDEQELDRLHQTSSESKSYPTVAALFLFQFHAGLRIEELIGVIRSRIPSNLDQQQQEAINIILKGLHTDLLYQDLPLEEIPGLAEAYTDYETISLFFVLKSMSGFVAARKEALGEEIPSVFMELLLRVFIYLLKQENSSQSEQYYTRRLLEYFFYISNSETTTTLKAQLSIVSEAQITFQTATLFNIFTQQVYEVITDPNHPQYPLVKDFVLAFLDPGISQSNFSIDAFAFGLFRRDSDDQSLNQIEWLRSVRDLSDSDLWFSFLYENIITNEEFRDLPRVFWVGELEGLLTSYSPLSLPYNFEIAELRDVLLTTNDSQPNTIVFSQELELSDTHFSSFEVSIQIQETGFYGKIKFDFFHPDTGENEHKELGYSWSPDEESSNFVWDFIDFENLPPDLEAALNQIVFKACDKFVTQRKVYSAPTPTDEHPQGVTHIPVTWASKTKNSPTRFVPSKRNHGRATVLSEDSNTEEYSTSNVSFILTEKNSRRIEKKYNSKIIELMNQKIDDQNRGANIVRSMNKKTNKKHGVPKNQTILYIKLTEDLRILALRIPGTSYAKIFDVVNHDSLN